MAVQDCDKISNIVAIQLLAWNDDLAKEIAELAATKNYAQTTIAKLWGEWEDLAWRSVNSLELMAKSAEIKIDAIVQSYILKWQAWEEALMEVAKQMSKEKRSLYGWVKLLEMIRGGSDVDIKEVARLWDNTLDTSTAMKQMEDTIADYVASDYSIYRAYNAIEDTLADTSKKIDDAKQTIKDAKVRLDRWIITDKEFRKIKKENDLTIKTLTKEKDEIKEVLEKDYKLAIDKIKAGWNPTWFSKLDSEWAAIKKVFWNDTTKASKTWTNYIMARELLAWWEMADEVLSVLAKEWENLVWDLTEEWIVKCTNLDTLIARAFTNTEQLCNNWMLRELYRDKLIQLSVWTRLTEENASKVKTLINTSLFAEEGMTLSDVVLDNRVYRSMKNLGYKVTEGDGERILNDLQRIAKAFAEDTFWDEDIVIKIAWQEMRPQDVVQLIYDATWDENIIKLLNSKNFSDTSILSIATQKLLWNNELAREWIINLFKKWKEWNKITNSRWVFFRALTGMEVPDWAKVWYFDYRRALYTKDELSDSKARLYDLISDKNKLRVEWDAVWDFTKDWQYSQENVEKLANEIKTNLKWGFLVVNDARWWDNQLLREAVDKLRKEWDLTILYPKWGQMSSFVWEWDNLFFKTIDDNLYDDIAWTISIQSLWAAKPTREILASAYEAATGRNGDKLRYQASYSDWWVDNLGRQISDQQVEYFARSVTRDENGNLMVFYHWTNVKFDTFDINAARRHTDIQWMFFSEREEEAKWYWQNVWEYYLNITNPAPASVAYDKVFKKYRWQTNAWVLAREELQRMGYDWVQSYSWEWIVFDSNQIKAVDNRLPTTDSNTHFMERENLYTINWKDRSEYYALPTEKELEEYLKKHNIEQELKDLFWITDDPNDAIFITTDWEFISWYWLDKEKYPWTQWIQVEHETAMDVLFFWDRRWIWRWLWRESRAWHHLLPLVMWKTWLIRVRPQLNGTFSIQVGKRWITNFQKSAIWDIIKEYNTSRNSGKTIFFESSAWQYNKEIRDEITNIDRIIELADNAPEFKYFNAVVDSHNKNIDKIWERVNIGDKLIPDNISRMKRVKGYASQPDMSITDALKVEMFTKDRTAQQIIDGYWFPMKILHDTDLIEWVKAWWAWGDNMLQFTDMVKESTVPHELFHAIFNTYVGKEQYDRVLEDAMKLFQVNAYNAEEILANSFADWFKTWNFTYWDKLKAITWKKKLTKEQKTFLQRVKDFFEDLAETLWLVDRHRAEVEQMFEDMVNMKYLPDDWKPVNPETALTKYNKELNDAAVNYFWKMLWLDATDPLYARNVETKLADMLWISLDSFDSFTDKASLYRRIDKQLWLELLTTGKFDREIVDIVNIRKEIGGLSEDDLEKQIKDELWVLAEWWAIKWNENIELIREAWFNYNTAEDMSQLLSAEWKIISLIKWTQSASLSLGDLKKLFKDKEELKKRYKEMFFAEQEVDDKVLDKFVKQINWDVYDSLSIQFVENLVKEWYDLPLINAKTAMYDYLNGKLDLNSDFARAFMYKNNIAMTSDNLNAIIEWALPREFSFDFTTFENKLADESSQGNISRVIKRKNQFLPDTYTALSAIEGARAWENLWWAEYQVLKGTVDKYVKAMKEWVKNSDFTFRDAQKLKQEFSYAMDTFEQEIILPKYSKFLTPEERQSLLWIKYSAPIAVWWQNAREVEKMLDNWANRILWREEIWPNWERIVHKWSYQNTMSQLANDNDINVAIAKWYDAGSLDDATIKRIERRRDQLISNWSTIKEVNWEYVVYDVKETLRQTLNNMPSSIEWYAGILALGREGIESLTNKQAYVLLRYLEAAKALATTSNYTTQLMYKQTPLLAQYSFFTTYAVDASTWLPRVMWNNSLASDNFFADILSSNAIDQDIKKDVFADIIKWFRENKYVTEDELGKMIDKAIDRQIDELWKLDIFSPQEKKTARWKMKNIYTNMFIPYSYLRDLPIEWGIREKLESTIKEAYNQAIKDLQAAWASDTDDIQKMIMIRMDDWGSKNLSELANVKIDDWKKTIFNDESILVRWADEVNVDEKFNWRFWEDDEDVERRLTKEQKKLREDIQNQYSATLQAIENQSQIISDAERELMVSFMSDVRTDLRKYSLTNKMVDALDAVSWMWEEVSRWMKNYIIWLRWMWTYGRIRTADIWARYDKVREAYKTFYNMPLESLERAKPRPWAEEVAWNAAKYFKNLERMLGSADGVTWVTTSAEVNRAFYHIWEVFMNLWANWASETWWIRWLFWMLSWIEQNQILKFFKFSNPNQASYVKAFKQTHKRDGRLLELVGWYRDYVETINNITREQFNSLFGTNYSDWAFKRVLQWLSWFTLAGWWFARRINKLLDVANSSRLAFRMMMSYPWQLLTIPQQWVAYFLKQLWYEQALWIEDMWRIDAIRESFWILDWAYNELNITRKLGFNPDSLDKSAFYNRYWIPTTEDLYKETGITTADDYINMYAKVDKKYSKPWKISSWIKWLDPYKDNANNFIDWIFARNFKNIAFVKWLRDNSYMKFASAEDFLEFMNDATVSAEVKSRLMDAIAASSGRNFRNILWLWFWWLDRPIGWAGWQNILYWLMQLFNFRWSWWQNIFKQTWENFWRMYKATLWMPWLSREAREKLVDYLWNTPEFVNFVTALLHDLEWSFKLQRYQDNGRWPDENEDPRHYFLDYLSYMRETMNMVSQWYQGIQSFWPIRPFYEWINSILESQMDPTIYHDTWWVWAFFNALWKNFGRQRKPINWFVELAWARQSWWPENMRAYIERQFFNLSFWSLRYMVNEDENSYWYTYEVSWQVWWIPSIAMWEAQIWSDKSFMYALDNSETWKTIQLIADDDVAWSDKKKYRGNLWKAFVNGSQLLKTGKNLIKIKNWEYNKSFFSSEDLAWIIQQTKAWKEFYDKWYVIPSTNEEAVTFIKTILNHSEYRPGSKQFNKSLLQFEDFGHMDAAKWNAGDAQMELWLEHMKYKTNEHWEFVKKNWERVVDENWNKLITNIKQYYSNEEYVSNVIYNYSKDWLDEHSSDPNYPLYLKMLWQWNAHMLIESELNKRKAIHNKWVKWDLKWTDANLDAAEYRDMILKMGNSILDGDNITFFEKLNRLDEDDATLAALKIIRDQATELWRTDIEKFFDVETSKEDDTIVEDVKLKPQYESVLRQIWQIGRAIDEWNADRVIAIMSSLTHQFKNDDPTGEITAMVINSTYDRINEAKNLSPMMKNEMMIGLFYDNKDFIQRNPEKMRELLWDAYDEYARKMNEMLYKWDGQIISNMEELITRNEDAAEIISKAAKKWSWASKALKNAATNFSWISGSWVGNGSHTTGQRAWQGYWEWVPVKVKWADLVKELWLKGYNPTNVNEIVFKHTPTADFSLAKDINRKIKTTKSQTISSKKQLSKLEEKAAKAIETES